MQQVQQVPAGFDAENADNFEDIEKQFAVKAVQHMETYWAILERVRGSTLRLTKLDDDILEHLQKDFPEFDPAARIDEDEMKSKTGKERWRNFMMAYEKKVDDYNFGTMMRIAPNVEYGRDESDAIDTNMAWWDKDCARSDDSHADDERTTMLTKTVPRMQFYAVEIARNRKGLNDWIYEKAQAEKAAKK
ncbi:hypothetical protein SPBR_02038 [Sporothrix brasiliensis 5110]|uniref:Polysaccharide biosynthesis domain-containing protein n=1 Tax=Sporothrix brasiliensis 5110 TaxID=1398154 RepID=A0A0C2J1T5_9PEZI|nr:uncharacterized protein SPBR_02038 [Sporothrix brasiliensis 5110]KIH91062.1 hypothetical protein SPBR_02038 [Sporothrix brasiliensis 5110]